MVCLDGCTSSWHLQWRRQLFEWELEHLLNLMALLQECNLVAGCEDVMCWKFDVSGSFSVDFFVSIYLTHPTNADSESKKYLEWSCTP